MSLFTEQELQTLAAEIDQQLSELAHQPSVDGGNVKGIKHSKKAIPSQQKQQLEHAIQEDADSFMTKFARAAKQDLCVEGGLLYAQWKKYGDLDNQDMLKTFGGLLVGLGVSSAFLAMAVVAVSVIVIHIGIKAFCEDCG
jgi:16S rRNA C1402 N4-methylase RsmH